MTFKKYPAAIFAALLAALVLAVYWQTKGFEFIQLDDHYYTVQNPIVKSGLTFSGIKEVFTTLQLYSFIPLTYLSFMADVEFFGLGSSGFHFTNTLLHLFNSLLLFTFLYRATGSGWKSFFAAALWALHPMRAESVAWIAERKDLLSGLFFFIGLVAYREYAKSSKPLLYAATLLSMLLGLLSKPVLVIFPLVLLILDFWPLERFRQPGETIKKLLVEKTPFFMLSVLFSLLTLYNHRLLINSQVQKPVLGRLADMATAYLHYLKVTVWPFGLVMDDMSTAVHLTGFLALGAGAFLLVLFFLAWKVRKTAPAVTAGWLWYLAVLFPTSGVILLDFYFVADHFTYLPHLGLMIALVWGAGDALGKLLKNPKVPAIAGAALVIGLSVLCFRQVTFWKDDFTLFGYIDRVTGGQSATAKKSLGVTYFNSGKYKEAYDHYGMALELLPTIRQGNGYKGSAAAKLGRHREAVELYRKELKVSPGDRDISVALVEALIMVGDRPGAARQALIHIRQWPGDQGAWLYINYLGGEEKARMLAGR
ncbi:tetratricopeptide repeat protein [bacterium]|nr:MAG: tetratricopeptide repeat protein [bacterium]